MSNPALKYRITLNPDPVHRYMDKTIDEIWLQDAKICVNSEGGAFRSDTPRVDEGLETIHVTDHDCRIIEAHVETIESLSSVVHRLFPE